MAPSDVLTLAEGLSAFRAAALAGLGREDAPAAGADSGADADSARSDVADSA